MRGTGVSGSRYTAQVGDEEHHIGLRSVNGPTKRAKALIKVHTKDIRLGDFSTVSGWTKSGTYSLLRKEGASPMGAALAGGGGLELAHAPGGGQPRATRNLSAAALPYAPNTLGGIVIAAHFDSYALSKLDVHLMRGSTTVLGTAVDTVQHFGRRFFPTHVSDWNNVPTDVASTDLRIMPYNKAPWNSRVRIDAIRARAGTMPVVCDWFDDGYRAPVEQLRAYYEARGHAMVVCPPLGMCPDQDNGGNRLHTAMLVSLLKARHVVGVNTRGDNPFTDYPSVAAALAEYDASRQLLLGRVRAHADWQDATAEDEAWLLDCARVVCLSNGRWTWGTQATTSANITVPVDTPTLATFVNPPTPIAQVGDAVSGEGIAIELANAPRVVAVSGDGKSLEFDGPLPTGQRQVVFVKDRTNPMYQKQLMDGFRSRGCLFVRATVAWSNNTPKHGAASNYGMSMRYGVGDWDMAVTAASLSSGNLAMLKKHCDYAVNQEVVMNQYTHDFTGPYAQDWIDFYPYRDAYIAAGRLDYMHPLEQAEAFFGNSMPD